MKTFAGNPRRGSSLVEFALCFTPVFFIILAVFEISRCMWTYETLSYSVTEATRLAIVHGENCGAAPNSCTITVAAIAQRIAASSQGLQPDQMTVGLASSGGGATVSCNPLSSCLANTAVWPVSPGNTRSSELTVSAIYPFQSTIATLFPGFLAVNLTASSQEQVQF